MQLFVCSITGQIQNINCLIQHNFGRDESGVDSGIPSFFIN